jgi:V-type H+-transporting ATPase subunit E
MAQGQIEQMISFILAEADDKAAEIHKKGEEEFSIEVHRLITEQKEKIRTGYERKSKQIETQYAIAKSTAVNQLRLEKIKARQVKYNQIAEDAKGDKLAKCGQDKAFLSKLIVQGLLMLLEPEVQVRCRASDVSLVQSVLKDAEAQYSKLIKDQTGVEKKCALTIDKNISVDPANLGGVVLACQNGKITIDNTVDVRLNLVMEQDKPAIRALMFPNR